MSARKRSKPFDAATEVAALNARLANAESVARFLTHVQGAELERAEQMRIAVMRTVNETKLAGWVRIQRIKDLMAGSKPFIAAASTKKRRRK